eukprot:COSAG01_NODE_61828_length_287_cov_1.585106_1_plen_51_part_10
MFVMVDYFKSVFVFLGSVLLHMRRAAPPPLPMMMMLLILAHLTPLVLSYNN